MTRRWNDHKQLMKLISLFLVCHHIQTMISSRWWHFQIDEVHILNEKRGACLEACVSRMQVKCVCVLHVFQELIHLMYIYIRQWTSIYATLQCQLLYPTWKILPPGYMPNVGTHVSDSAWYAIFICVHQPSRFQKSIDLSNWRDLYMAIPTRRATCFYLTANWIGSK